MLALELDADGRRLSFPGTRFTVGSGPACDVRLEGPALEPMHAELFVDDRGQWWIRGMSKRARIRVDGRYKVVGHPNIVDITDFGSTEDGRFYFVMELLGGCTLRSVLHDEGPLAQERVLCIGGQLCASGPLESSADVVGTIGVGFSTSPHTFSAAVNLAVVLDGGWIERIANGGYGALSLLFVGDYMTSGDLLSHEAVCSAVTPQPVPPALMVTHCP